MRELGLALGGVIMANGRRPIDEIKGTVWIDYRTDVPNWLVAEIGRIAVEWSRLEAHFEELIRLLVQVEIHYGRMLTTGMTLRSRIATATNLAQGHVLYGSLKPAMRDEIIKFGKAVLGDLDGERNKLIHGLWGRLDGEWTLVKMSGTRKIDPVGKLPRPVLPQKEAVTKTTAKEVRERIRKLNAQMASFCEKLEAELPPSPHKSRRQLRQTHPSRARKGKAP
jgi:hypothetical protein